MLTGPEYQNTSTLPISQLGSRSTQVWCGAAAPVWTIQHLSHFQALWSTGSTALMWGIPTTQCPTRGTRISMLNIRSVILHHKIKNGASVAFRSEHESPFILQLLQALAQQAKGVKFVGRLASYKYFNMDQAILNALEFFDTDIKTLNWSGNSEWSPALWLCSSLFKIDVWLFCKLYKNMEYYIYL